MTGQPDRKNPDLFGPFPRVSSLRMAARLFLGAALSGSDELNRRYEPDQRVYRPAPAERELLISSESESDRRRYAVIGAIVETTRSVQERAASASRLADRAYRAFSHSLRPVTGSRIAQPVNRRIDRFAAKGDAIVRGWVAAGRAEEQLSRSLAGKVTTQSVESTLDYLARSPEMDELMKEQSYDLVEGMVGDAQGGSSGPRARFYRWVGQAILNRPQNTSTQADANEVRAVVGPPEGD